jgi:energy-coupling factor transporter transmembrane protein EcfT
MTENLSNANTFSWRLPSIAVLLAFVVFISLAVCQSDTALFTYLFLVGPILVLVSISLIAYLITRKGRPKRLTLLSTLAIIWVLTPILFFVDLKYHFAIRTTARWLVWSRDYKEKVLAQPASANGDLRHVEWDGWGWGGNDTVVFLVFDPTDSLSAAALNHQSGKYSGIPCKVPFVGRLERQWYTVEFYTGQDWGVCR